MAAYPCTHVIFDMDGLLLDTERLYTIATQEVVGPYGKTFTWDIKSQMMGRKADDAIRILIDALELPLTIEEYKVKIAEKYKDVFPACDILPGVEKLVQHLHKHNIPMAVASGSNKHDYDLKTLQHSHLFDKFCHVVLSSDDPDVKHGKPAPDCFLICAQRFKDSPDPEKVLVFEDAKNGVLGGLAANMQVVWVPDKQADKSELVDHATLTLDSLEEFQPEQFGLPAYDS
ncbi:pseudouridine-5'-phosphatase-like [Lineus longissimus]|uniref:pseudouridine-5'-phosphatase-like n=1 Tax=Lineus longissimus TaxID=88925 RepID=UPI002B4F3874